MSDADLRDEADVKAGLTTEDEADPADAEREAPEPDDEDDAELAEAPTRRRTALVISVVMVLLMTGLVAVLFKSESDTSDREAESPLIGEPAPPIEGETIGGGSFNLDDHVGQWVVVNFFATWCPPCVEEHPELSAFDQVHRELGDAALISVIFGDEPTEVADFFGRYGGDWPVVRDDVGQVAVDYGVARVPETYLVDPQGIVRARLVGGVTRNGLEDAIARFEAEDAAARDASGEEGS